MEIVGVIAGRAVYVAVEDDHQVIRMRTSQVSLGLATLMGPYRMVSIDGAEWIEIEHTPEVDQRLVELVDVASGIRYDHPRMVQLEMFAEAEAVELHA